jgi:hypothetical protein
MQNRLKKLHSEENRLRMQIMLAHKNSDLADQFAARRQQDFDNKTNH